jgi:hypothetical protein
MSSNYATNDTDANYGVMKTLGSGKMWMIILLREFIDSMKQIHNFEPENYA